MARRSPGGGTGGTVAFFGKIEALKEQIPQIAQGIFPARRPSWPDVFEGTSSGAVNSARAVILLAPTVGLGEQV